MPLLTCLVASLLPSPILLTILPPPSTPTRRIWYAETHHITPSMILLVFPSAALPLPSPSLPSPSLQSLRSCANHSALPLSFASPLHFLAVTTRGGFSKCNGRALVACGVVFTAGSREGGADGEKRGFNFLENSYRDGRWRNIQAIKIHALYDETARLFFSFFFSCHLPAVVQRQPIFSPFFLLVDGGGWKKADVLFLDMHGGNVTKHKRYVIRKHGNVLESSRAI